MNVCRCSSFSRFIKLLTLVFAISLSHNAWSTVLTCSALDPAQVPFVQNNFGDLNTTKFTIETSYPTPGELFKICDVTDGVPEGGVAVTVIEEIKNVGDTPWHDWHSTLTSPIKGTLINGAFLTGVTGTISISNGMGSAAGEASLGNLSVILDDPIEMNEMFTLTQQILLPRQSGDFSFGLTETPSIGEPSIFFLFVIGYLSFLTQRRRAT